MKQYKKSAVIIGVLFLVALLPNIVANEMAKTVLSTDIYLSRAYPKRNMIVVINILNIICAVAMIFIPLVLLQVVKQQHKPLAISYVVFRALEGILFLYIAIRTFTFIDISKMCLTGIGKENEYASLSGRLVQAEIRWATIVYLVCYVAGAIFFYSLLFKSQMIPKWLSVWGGAGVLLLALGTCMALFEYGIFKKVPLMQGMAWFAPPIALNELVVAVWLIVKGFNIPAQQYDQKSNWQIQ